MNKIKTIATAATVAVTMGFAGPAMATNETYVVGLSMFYAKYCSDGFTDRGVGVIGGMLLDSGLSGDQMVRDFDFRKGTSDARAIGCNGLTGIYADKGLLFLFK